MKFFFQIKERNLPNLVFSLIGRVVLLLPVGLFADLPKIEKRAISVCDSTLVFVRKINRPGKSESYDSSPSMDPTAKMG